MTNRKREGPPLRAALLFAETRFVYGLVTRARRHEEERIARPRMVLAVRPRVRSVAIDHDVGLLARRIAAGLRWERRTAGRATRRAAVPCVRGERIRVAAFDGHGFVVAAEDAGAEAVVEVRRDVRDPEVVPVAERRRAGPRIGTGRVDRRRRLRQERRLAADALSGRAPAGLALSAEGPDEVVTRPEAAGGPFDGHRVRVQSPVLHHDVDVPLVVDVDPRPELVVPRVG